MVTAAAVVVTKLSKGHHHLYVNGTQSAIQVDTKPSKKVEPFAKVRANF